MKTILYLLLFLLPATQLLAQAPPSIPYQAVVRNSSGKALTNQAVKVRFSIRDSIASGAVVYQETQAATANAQGLVNVNIGQGAASQGSFAGINWGTNNKFIQTEIDIAGGSNFTDFGTTQFMSVPYALYAASAGNAATGTLPTVETGSFSGVSHISAIVNGNIINNGGHLILAQGICYSTKPHPTVANALLRRLGVNDNGTFSDNFYFYLDALEPATTYYVRVFATSTAGTSYGEEKSFTTNIAALPSVVIAGSGSVSYTTAGFAIEVTNIGDDPFTQTGICYDTSPNPTVANSKLISGSGYISLSSLLPGTTYYVRAFGTNKGGTVYGISAWGSEISFTTLANSAPSISTTPFSIGTTTAAGGGNVTSDGGSTITQRGICWSTEPSPTLQNNFTADGTGTGSFNSSLTGLTLSTQYYVRAYATNSLGTTYGAELNFTTLATAPSNTSLPILGTSLFSKNTVDYSSGGYISSDGGAAITQQGICWNTLGNPSLTDSVKYFTPTGVGYYTLNFNLPYTCQQTYYVRAFAKNSVGTVYASNQTTTTTGFNAKVSTVAITNIIASGATVSGNISVDGGCAVTERGICYSTAQTPTTTTGQKVIAGTGSGAFSGDITNLAPGNTYYVRVYAITAMGTFYGEQQQFTTIIGSTLGFGQRYQGGLVFYLDSTKQHGLVADTADLINVFWGCDSTYMLGAKDTAIGKGAQNTAAIVAECSLANTENNAAKYCDNLVRDGFSDWYLPSLAELRLMYRNLKLNGLGGFGSNSYCSSSEYDAKRIYRISFSTGTSSTTSKSSRGSDRTRAVRSF